MAVSFPRGGLDPVNIEGNPPVTAVFEVDSTAAALFVGSLVQVVSGKVKENSTTAATGIVKTLWNSKGKAVSNKVANATGFTAEITTDPDQLYIVTMKTVSGTAFADADVGKYFNLTAEGSTASADPLQGTGRSSREGDANTLNASGTSLPLQAGQRIRAFKNDAGDGCAIRCKINPTYFKMA